MVVDTLDIYSVASILTPTATYNDSFFTYKQQKTTYEQGFTLNEIDALSGINDTTINNYTSQYITNKRLHSDVFSYDVKDNTRNNITSPLIFNPLHGADNFKYLYIYSITGLSATDAARPYTVTPSLCTTFLNNIYFEIEFLSNEFLRIKHNNGKYDFFLNAVNEDQIAFFNYRSESIPLTSERSDMFRYLVDDDGYLQLFKRVDDEIKILSLSGTKLTLIPIIGNTLNKSSNTLIRINYAFNKIELKGNSSWVGYDKNKVNTLTPDDERSSYNRPGQYLLHTAYNDPSNLNLNYLTLNTDRSEKGFIKRGSNLFTDKYNTPDADFREYTTLHTGNDQEKGNDNISLNYVFYDKDIKIKNGTDTYFTVPSSIYPYDKLNINDSRFVLNGSLGGPSPLFSDKVFLKRKDTTQSNNGRYLCTWLSANNLQASGLWVDRYYYPDAITKEAALTAQNFRASFLNDVDTTVIRRYASDVTKEAFFDKTSDVCLEPNAKMMYQRLDSQDFKQVVRLSSPYVYGITSYYNTKNNIVPFEGTSILYDSTKYNRYSVAEINNTSQFTISFELYVNPDKSYGYQILGNKTSHGFGVQNDVVITPFIYVRNKEKLYIYNTDYVLLSQTTFDKPIRDLIINKPLEDFYVACNDGYIYKVNALGNKVKLEILPEIVGYKNFHQDDETITFLVNEAGACIQVRKYSLQIVSYFNAEPLTIYKDLPLIENYAQSIIKYNDIYYYVPGDRVKFDAYNSSKIFYVQSGRSLIRYDLKTNVLDTFAKSNYAITDFNIDDEKNIAIAWGDNVTLFSDKRRKLYDIALSNTNDILSGSKILGVDFVKADYSLPERLTSLSLLLLDRTNNLHLALVQPEEGDVNITPYSLGLSAQYAIKTPPGVGARHPQTNFNYIATTEINNALRFNLTLVNYLNTEDVINKNIIFNLQDIDIGYHTFTYRFDSIQGNITLFVDGVQYKNLTVSPGKYKIQNIFADDIFIGTTGFYNGVDLATYLRQPGSYFINGLEMKNLFIYDRAVRDDEIIAISLHDTTINDLVLSIPCGQRNNIEEIERVFKYSNDNSSKNIDINIKNLSIANENIRNDIRNVVFEQVRSLLPIGISINNINFLDSR
jgi:hypothetical protein